MQDFYVRPVGTKMTIFELTCSRSVDRDRTRRVQRSQSVVRCHTNLATAVPLPDGTVRRLGRRWSPEFPARSGPRNHRRVGHGPGLEERRLLSVPCPTWSSCATASPPGTPRASSPAGSTSTSRPGVRPRPARPGGSWWPSRTGASTSGSSTPRSSPGPSGRPTWPSTSSGRTWLPVRRHWRLNERHYGALQGKNKKETTAEFGIDQVKVWRRSYATRPPALAVDDRGHPAHDPRYRDVPAAALPASECLADVVARMVPYWEDAIVPDLHAFGGVLVVAHGNSLRALVKYLTDLSDDEVVGLEIPTGVPWWFRLADDLSVTEERQLGDPDAIKAAMEETARQAG